MSDWEEHDDDAVGVIDLEQEGGAESTQLCAPPMAPRWTSRGAASVCNAPR